MAVVPLANLPQGAFCQGVNLSHNQARERFNILLLVTSLIFYAIQPGPSSVALSVTFTALLCFRIAIEAKRSDELNGIKSQLEDVQKQLKEVQEKQTTISLGMARK